MSMFAKTFSLRKSDCAAGRARLLALPLMIAALCAGNAEAASGKAGNKAASSEASQQYKEEKAACMTGQTHQERTACLKEANAALYESRRGTLANVSNQSTFEQNALARCQSLPASERESCRGRIMSGTQQGSADDGGILREYRETVASPDSRMPSDTSTGSSMSGDQSGTGSSMMHDQGGSDSGMSGHQHGSGMSGSGMSGSGMSGSQGGSDSGMSGSQGGSMPSSPRSSDQPGQDMRR